MQINLTKTNEILPDCSCIYIIRKSTSLKAYPFSKTEFEYIKKQLEEDEKQIAVNSYFRHSFIQVLNEEKEFFMQKEELRKGAHDLLKKIRAAKVEEILIVDELWDPELSLAFIEGLGLSAYRFSKYMTDKKDQELKLKQVKLFSSYINEADLAEIKVLCEAVYLARDLVNEPVVYLNAEKLAEIIQSTLVPLGCKVEVFNKNRIKSLKMGGILAVNKGSVDPPTFSVIEWKPENAVNEKPLILVGKGVVFDTGGLSLKSTTDSMDYMKSDMSGAAAVFGAVYAIAKRNVPLYLIGLIPATDNRPGGNAIAPGDVITMYNGTSVEVTNTDAEGRLILADALSYARQYDPQLVIDLATLTGSAKAAIGSAGIVAFSTADEDTYRNFEESGWNVYERLVKFPLWDEYSEAIKSDIADLKNLGGKNSGAITAAKFLQHFVDYPWIHLDIAGPSYLGSHDSYRGKGGTGAGIRLLFDFLKNSQ
jgi:leucyl aminopeptidase